MKQSTTTSYFKELRNWYHFLIGISLGYDICLALFSNRENFPISWEYYNNALYPIVAGVFLWGASFYWEKRQDDIRANSSDMRDVWFSSASGVIGGVLTMFFASWYFAVPMTLISVLLVIKHYKK